MNKHCSGNCITCGKCNTFPILDNFRTADEAYEPRDGLGVAIDIGTTTVVLTLLDLAGGTALKRHSFLNPQRKYGPDVISRISAAANGAVKDDMRHMINAAIKDGIAALTKETLIDGALAANTLMTHLLLGYDCESLGVSPFKSNHQPPAFHEISGQTIRIVPWLSGFVGGDILAGLLFVPGVMRFLLIDLGTNGEIALYDHGRLLITSTAAGPAFEGAMHGGASAVISQLAGLVRDNTIDETGYIENEDVFTREQVRSLQLAKSAVRSGIDILLSEAGLRMSMLDAVYLAGGIGQAMDIDDAAAIGLLPRELINKVSAVGNASLGGAAMMLLAPQQTAAHMQALMSNVREVNLAAHRQFSHLFMENMFFEPID